MTTPPPIRVRMPSRPEAYAGPDRRAPVERPAWARQLEIDVTQAQATAERIEAALPQVGAKGKSWVLLLVGLAGTPTGLTVWESFRAPPPPPPALTSEDARLIRAEAASQRETIKDLVTEVKALRSAVDRQEGARLARERD